MLKGGEVEVKPFRLKDFMPGETDSVLPGKVTKRELKILADTLGLVYNEEQIHFTKKLINAYMRKDR